MDRNAVPQSLRDFFGEHPRLALAFSGGVDSAYLLYAAVACGCDAGAFYAQSAFQPAFERADALRLAEQLGAKLTVVPLDVLADERVRSNPENRCYFCKQAIFSALIREARAQGYDTVMDGTNASDDAGDRPGMRALKELSVLSPLRLCGLTKSDVRRYSREAGLFTWDKPAYACLATRVKTGETITAETLRAVEASEDALFALGFTDLRVRTSRGAAKLQFIPEQLPEAQRRFDEIRDRLTPYFTQINIDPAGREKSK